VAGRIRSIEKSNNLIGTETRDLLACSTVPQPTTLPSTYGLNACTNKCDYSEVTNTVAL
jgi:hypothetical protein